MTKGGHLNTCIIDYWLRHSFGQLLLFHLLLLQFVTRLQEKRANDDALSM